LISARSTPDRWLKMKILKSSVMVELRCRFKNKKGHSTSSEVGGFLLWKAAGDNDIIQMGVFIIAEQIQNK